MANELSQDRYADMQICVVPGSETEGVLWSCGRLGCILINRRLEWHLLACERFALRPVGWDMSFFASGLTPKRTGGGGPVFWGMRGGATGCWGIGGSGGGEKVVPKPGFCMPVGVGCSGEGRNELIPVCCGNCCGACCPNGLWKPVGCGCCWKGCCCRGDCCIGDICCWPRAFIVICGCSPVCIGYWNPLGCWLGCCIPLYWNPVCCGIRFMFCMPVC